MVIRTVIVVFAFLLVVSGNSFSLNTALHALQRREAQFAEEGRLPSKRFANEDFPNSSFNEKSDFLEDLDPKYRENLEWVDSRIPAAKYDFTNFRERELFEPQLARQFLDKVDKEEALEQDFKYLQMLNKLSNNRKSRNDQPYNDVIQWLNLQRNDYPDIPLRKNTAAVVSQHDKYKRQYPLLPWLPARRKRFPVAKRSPEPSKAFETDEKVTKELKEIFDKDSKNETNSNKETKKASDSESKKQKQESGLVLPLQGLWQEPYNIAKRNVEECDPDNVDCNYDDEGQEGGHEYYEDSEETDEGHDHWSKEKREVKLEKRALDWSQYFGLNRRKKQAYHQSNTVEDSAIDKIDRQLEILEKKLIDETVKYVGANEGAIEPSDIPTLKDAVISKLLRAYNLGKVRRILQTMEMKGSKSNDHLDSKEPAFMPIQ